MKHLYIFISCFTVLGLFTAYGTGSPYQEQAQKRCYMNNEEYTDCGSACQQTCDSIISSERIGCIAVCVPGCFCRKDYVRNRWNNCIPKTDCPCQGANEIYTCDSCQTTCDTLNQDCSIGKCTVACFCKPGYARDNNGICVPLH